MIGDGEGEKNPRTRLRPSKFGVNRMRGTKVGDSEVSEGGPRLGAKYAPVDNLSAGLRTSTPWQNKVNVSGLFAVG